MCKTIQSVRVPVRESDEDRGIKICVASHGNGNFNWCGSEKKNGAGLDHVLGDLVLAQEHPGDLSTVTR